VPNLPIEGFDDYTPVREGSAGFFTPIATVQIEDKMI